MLQRRGRIALTVHTLGQGGTDRVCAHLARGFAAAGYDTEVVLFCAGGTGTAALLPLFGPDVRLTVLGRRRGPRAADLVRLFPAFVAHLRRARPDALISTGNNMSWATALGLRAAALPDCRLLLKTTNPVVRPKDSLLARLWRTAGYARAFAAADRVLTLSDAETRELRARFPKTAGRFRTVPNPYATPAMLAPHPVLSEPGVVLAVGRLMAQKRFDRLLRAFAHVRDPAARLVILGEGPDRAALEALARTLGIAARVEMPGFVADPAPWFARASLFALTSAYEGLPAVVIEAMAAECPVVATDCFAAARELIGGTPGCAVADAADPVAFARRIDLALASPRPAGLRAIAARYGVAAAVEAHVGEVARLLAVPATAYPVPPLADPVPATA